MAEIKAKVKLQIPGGTASPAPPVGTALGPQGINMMDFCKAFNAQTASRKGETVPVVVTVYKNRTFDFIINGRYAELKGKGASLDKMDFISLTNKQYTAIGKTDFDIYLICGLNTNNPEMYKIDPKKLIKTRTRKVVSYEYDKAGIKKII